MKRLILFLIALPMFILAGCSTIRPGHDPIVVNAERSIAAAFETFDVLLKLEYDNRDRLLALEPDIHKATEVIRMNGKGWIQSATSTVRVYKKNRTAENKASLITAVAVLNHGLSEAEKYLAKVK